MIKKWVDRIKTFIGAWKIWLFFLALFGTNGAQFYAHSEPVSEKPAKTVSSTSKPQKTIIIRKADNSYCDKKLEEHKTGSQH